MKKVRIQLPEKVTISCWWMQERICLGPQAGEERADTIGPAEGKSYSNKFQQFVPKVPSYLN